MKSNADAFRLRGDPWDTPHWPHEASDWSQVESGPFGRRTERKIFHDGIFHAPEARPEARPDAAPIGGNPVDRLAANALDRRLRFLGAKPFRLKPKPVAPVQARAVVAPAPAPDRDEWQRAAYQVRLERARAVLRKGDFKAFSALCKGRTA